LREAKAKQEEQADEIRMKNEQIEKD